MKENIVCDKSFKFAIRIINFYKYLIRKKEYIISKQLLRSGTSIGANIEEALGGQTEKDFVYKLSIAYKEARETKYWIKLLKETNYVNEIEFLSIYKDCDELCRIIGKIQITMKNKIYK